MHTVIYNKLRRFFHQSPLKGYSVLLTATLMGLLILSSCEFQSNSTETVTSWPMLKDCPLHQQACEAKQAQQSVRLQISPKPIKVARMLEVDVQLQGINAQKVELDIAGENMYMGYNRVPLAAVPNQPGYFRGQSMLAFCTLDDMHWQVSVLITQPNNQVLVVPFALDTPRR